MVSQLVTLRHCDVHLTMMDQRVDATGIPFVITLDGITRELDLCEPCADTHVAPIRALVDMGGPQTVPDRPMRRAVDRGDDFYACPDCPSVLSSRGSLLAHLKSRHGLDSTTAVARMPPRRYPTQTGTSFPCPEPGCDFVAAAPAGLGAHRRHRHGIVGAASRNLDM